MNTNDILNQEFSAEFVKLMQARVEQSFHKYGPARANFAEGRVDPVKTAKICLDAFEKDHNTEHLIDAANYFMFAFKFRNALGYDFRSTGSSESVGTVGTPINFEKEI